MRKITVILLAMVMVFGFAGCGGGDGKTIGETIVSIISGDVTGEVGKTYRTEWFEFSVDALETTKEYQGGNAADNYTYVVATVTEKNTWSEKETLTMGTFDFYLDISGHEVYAEEAWNDNMMPEEFDLAVGETVTYDVVFLVPVETKEVKFVYVEIDEEEGVGATFTIVHKL